MAEGKIVSMGRSATSLPRGRGRDQRLSRVVEARSRLTGVKRGRAWINGREVGGTDPRFAHLAAMHD
jgi:hypothetical protein